MSKFFISYSRKDEDKAQRFVNELKMHRFDVWIDSEQISVGENWIRAIQQAIANSGAILVLLSPNSAASEWVKLELSEALKHTNPKLIVPVIIEGDPQAVIPDILKGRQFVDARLNKESAIQKLESILELYSIPL